MTLQQKMADLIGQWEGTDATQRSASREQLVAELIQVMEEEVRQNAPKSSSLFCAFCAPRMLEPFFLAGLSAGKPRTAKPAA